MHLAGFQVEAHAIDAIEIRAGYADKARVIRVIDGMDFAILVDASMAAIGAGCSSSYCGLSTPGNGINTLTVVGGRIEGNAHSVTIKTGNTYFDRRFTAVPGFSPPWFPSTTVSLGDIAVAATPAVTPTVQRLAWSTSPQ